MSYRLLVADSSPTVQKILEQLFSLPEYELLFCRSREELLLWLKDQTPDAIILSLSLPNCNGVELVAELNSHPALQGKPLFLLRQAFEPSEEKRLSSLAFTAIVAKPFDSEKLAEDIKQALGQTKEPETLPEEPAAEAIQPLPGGNLWPEIAKNLMSFTRQAITQEVVTLEREIEKRLLASLQACVKDWVEEEMKARLKGK